MGGKRGSALGNDMRCENSMWEYTRNVIKIFWEQHGNSPGAARAEHCNFRGIAHEEYGTEACALGDAMVCDNSMEIC